MKKAFYFLAIILFQISFGQNKNDDFAEFFPEKGEPFKANYISFTTKTFETGGFILFNKITSFKYEDSDGKKKNMDADDLKKIVFQDEGGPSVFEKIKFKIVKKDKIEPKIYDEFENLIYDGKIQLYGSAVDVTEAGFRYYHHSNFFIKKPEDSVAILAVKPKNLTFSGTGNSFVGSKEAFRNVGGKCENFNHYISSLNEKQIDSDVDKEYTKVYKQTVQDAKDKKINKVDILREFGHRYHNYLTSLFIGIIKEYEKNCP